MLKYVCYFLFIISGQFVIEYVGELIDDEEFRRRIEEMHKVKEENYYFLTIDKDIMIDAGPKGNLARWGDTIAEGIICFLFIFYKNFLKHSTFCLA